MANICGTTGFVVDEGSGSAISPRVKCADYDFTAQSLKSEVGEEGTFEPVDFADDGSPIFYDSDKKQFFVEKFVGGGGGIAPQFVRLLPGDPLLAQVFGKAQSGQLAPGISPNTLANIQEQARQFDLSFQQGEEQFAAQNERLLDKLAQTGQFNQAQLDQAREIFNARSQQDADQFNIGTQVDVEQRNADRELSAQLANQDAQIRVAETNAALRAEQAVLQEDIRRTDIEDARSRESLRFALRQEDIRTREGNRTALQNAVQIRENIESRIESNRLTRQGMQTQVQGLNAQIENNVAEFNAQERGRVEQLNEQRRQANLQQLQSVSRDIGTLSQNPADVGKLAGFLRSGSRAPITEAIGRGEDAITNESLTGLRGLLGVREGLQQGPTQATGNFIDANLVDVPQFGNDLGIPPDIAELFQAIGFDPSGIERGASPAAGDLSQFFQMLGLPAEIQAQINEMPPELQAQAIAALGGGGDTGGGAGGGGATGGGAAGALPASVREPFQPVINPITPPPRTFGGTNPREESSLVLPGDSIVTDVGANLTQELVDEFFGRLGQPVAMAHGGTTRSPLRLVGEDGPELDIDNPDGSTTVIPLPPEFSGLPMIGGGGGQSPELRRINDAVRSGAITREQVQARFQQQEGDSTFRKPAAGEVTEFQAADTQQPTRISDPTPRTAPTPFFPTITDGPTRVSNPTPLTSPTPFFPTIINEPQPTQPNVIPAPLPPATSPVGLPAPAAAAPAPVSPVSQPDAVIPPAPGIAQTAQNPLTTEFGPVTAEIARMFQGQVFQDALRRGGFSDISQISPIRVSAPGTSNFLQQLSASVSSAGGFGPASLFFEELQRLQPTGVRQGVARRTA